MLLVLSCLFLLLSDAASGNCDEASSICPPFRSPPSFPFGFTTGCGHPAFQIHCSAENRSLISIGGSIFSVLDRRADSLRISPVDGFSTVSQIDLSGSPFIFAAQSCSRLAAIRPCRSEVRRLHSNCSAVDAGGSAMIWRACLLSRPMLLLKGCHIPHHRRLNTSRRENQEGSESSVFANMTELLRSGVWIQWRRLTDDVYFSNCSSCRSKLGACGFNESDPLLPFLCLAPGFAALPGGGRDHKINRVVFLAAGLLALACLSVLVLSAAIILRRSFGSGRSCDGGENVVAAFFRGRQLDLQPRVFTYDQLCSSTGNFGPERKIGDGGFGSVYLGQLEEGRTVAVKRLHRRHPSSTTASFCNEILILSSIQHPNLVRLQGYCCDPRGLLLVYDYVSNGTLAYHLHEKGSLPWAHRVSIALQTAMALDYLHFSVKPPVVHRDVTSSNIFIDDEMKIKLGDFGLSRLLCLPDSAGSSEYVWTGPQGTPGYLDPDYHLSFRLTEKSDVYSFGVVLLELVTGMKAVDLRRDKQEISLANLVVARIQIGALQQVLDPGLFRHGRAMGSIEAVAELAFRCVAGEKDDRPSARELVSELKRIQNRLLD